MLIVVDGGVDLPLHLEDSPLIRRVSGDVWLGPDRFSGTRDEFWRLLREETALATTAPTVTDLADAYRHHSVVVGVHVSAELSATVARAHEAASRVGAGVNVVDTRSLSVGAGLIAARVHEAITDQGPGRSIAENAGALPSRLHTYALVQDPEFLRRSGRIGLLPRGSLGRRRPLLLAVRGRVIALEQLKDRHDGVRRLGRHAKASWGPRSDTWALGHGDAPDVDRLVDQLSVSFGTAPSFVSTIGPVVGTHVGPEALVVAVLSGAIDD
ncbi:MAG: DegV family protein [Acidimicrobiales bacterium]